MGINPTPPNALAMWGPYVGTLLFLTFGMRGLEPLKRFLYDRFVYPPTHPPTYLPIYPIHSFIHAILHPPTHLLPPPKKKQTKEEKTSEESRPKTQKEVLLPHSFSTLRQHES